MQNLKYLNMLDAADDVLLPSFGTSGPVSYDRAYARIHAHARLRNVPASAMVSRYFTERLVGQALAVCFALGLVTAAVWTAPRSESFAALLALVLPAGAVVNGLVVRRLRRQGALP